jgi:predicted transcriptional regulator/transcriptional regulator with XRE-family HTH domain
MTDRTPGQIEPGHPEAPRLGAKIRALRRKEGLTQAALARKLDVSVSYLNLIENDRRPLPAPLLIRIAQLFNLNLHAFATDEDTLLLQDMLEAMADPVFGDIRLTNHELREFCVQTPNAAQAFLSLYRNYAGVRDSLGHLAARMTEAPEGSDRSGRALAIPSEEVSDLFMRHQNYFPALEEAAEDLMRRAAMTGPGAFGAFAAITRYAERELKVRVRFVPGGVGGEADGAATGGGESDDVMRRFDPDTRVLELSELLSPEDRKFQLAHQVGLLSYSDIIDRQLDGDLLTRDESRRLARVALANYFAGAVLMGYGPFLQAAVASRYDIEVLSRRFGVSFEQVCHRLTTLRRPGAEGVPFHFLRVDVAGNITKRYMGSGVRFARYAGGCPRWNVFAAFLTPGVIRTQVSRMPDGLGYFSIARTLWREAGQFRSTRSVRAIELGCELARAGELVYADGMDLNAERAVVPVGVTCRLCERVDCAQRAFPSIQSPMKVDENVRTLSAFLAAKK